MQGRRRAALGMALVLVAGCGGGDGNSEARPETRERESTTATREEAPSQATSHAECVELWNATLHPGTAGQKAPSDFLAEIAADRPTKVAVGIDRGHCIVLVRFPSDPTRGYGFVAVDGRAPYNHPGSVPIPAATAGAFIVRARPNGELVPP